MNNNLPNAQKLNHHIRKMSGRDEHEENRTATSLELLFDLTFVISFGFASSQFAHFIAEGHYANALIGFAFSSFAICWAWINFSWFASAYDTDDWVFRLMTMMQMTGVLIFALGIKPMFISLEHGHHIETKIIIFGYIIMRFSMVLQWLRAAKQDSKRRKTNLNYAIGILIAQIFWVATLFLNVKITTMMIISTFLILFELAIPILSERKTGGTPWHAHHISERYMLFAIIALGEGLVGTVASLSSNIEASGWSLDTILVGLGGTGLTFCVWWIYMMLPSAHILHSHRNRSFVWGYGQLITICSIVAIGAGLHVAAYFIAHEAHINSLATILSIAIPFGVFIVSIYLLYYHLVRSFDTLHIFLLSGTLFFILLSIFAAIQGINMAYCLIILNLAPIVTIIGYELFGHKYQANALIKNISPK